jgi:ribose/xylose/arabinose/galactoside ABC-type transport system permease subunit
VLVLGIILMQFTPMGRRPRPEVAKENGSCLGRGFYTVLPYVLSGLAAGCAGVLLLSQSAEAMSLGVPRKLCNLLGEGAYTAVPNNLAALVILAAILGGAPFGGGFGSAVGGVLATILLVVASEVAVLSGVYIPALPLLGGLILAAALLMRIYFGLYSVGFRGKSAE